MAGAKLSPRQRMINMMYLVLIALLALNVSKEILKSFHLMEQSFNTAYTNIESKNKATMAALNKKNQESPGKTKPYLDRAKAVQKTAADFISFIDGVKAKVEELYADGDGVARDEETGEMLAADQMEAHARYFIEIEGGKYGQEVKDKINTAREDILAYLKPKAPGITDSTNIKDDDLYKEALASCQLRADDDPNSEVGPWQNENLEHQPTASLMAILSRIKNDAKTLESDVLSRLASRVDATDYKFDKLEAKVLAKSNYVMSGEAFEADILLVASSSKANPIIKVGESNITVEAGVGKYKVGASGIGFKKFAGEIIVKGPEGDKAFPFESEYQVFKPSATIAATEMNLLYIGIDNPMAISVPGFSAADINVSAPGANLRSQGAGKYNCTVSKGTREVTISCSLKKGGKRLGSQKFRVRNLPKPTAQLGGIPNDGLPKPRAQVLAQNRVLATMGQGFAYDLKYRVTGFRLIIAYKRKPAAMSSASSGALTGQMQQMIRSAAPGDRILIEGIKATEAKYGFSANLSPIVITVR